MVNAVTIVLADHQVVVAEGLKVILDAEDDLAVLDVAHNDRQAITSASQHQPAVLVLDAQLPDRDLGQTLAAIRAACPATKLLVLSGTAEPETATAVPPFGADGYARKDGSSPQVASLIRKLAAGQQAVVAAAAPSRPGRDPIVEVRLRSLSDRERELLNLVAMGWSSRRIAAHWQVSYHTVRSHMQSLLAKLDVRSQLAAALFAIRHGVVAIGTSGLPEPSRPAAS